MRQAENAWTAAAPWARGMVQKRFQPQRLNVRSTPGRRILLNATPANGLSAPTSDRPENAECDAPYSWSDRGVVARYLLLRRLILFNRKDSERDLTHLQTAIAEGRTLGKQWACGTKLKGVC